MKTVFKAEKEKSKLERNYESPSKRIVMPTDSVFSENFKLSTLMKPQYINWAHQFEKPIAEQGEEIKDYQVDCIFNESEFHVNL